MAHEELIRAWERLRQWVEDGRTAISRRNRLDEQAQEWERSRRDPAYLYRGSELVLAQGWAKDNPDQLTAKRTAFLEASDHAQRDEIAGKLRTLARLKKLTAALVAVALLAAAAAGVAYDQRRHAQDNAKKAGELAIEEGKARKRAETEADRANANEKTANGLAVKEAEAREQAEVEADRAKRQLVVNLFQHGRTLLAAGQVEEARDRFTRAQRLIDGERAPSLLVGLGWWEYYRTAPPPVRSIDANLHVAVYPCGNVAIHPEGRTALVCGGLPVHVDFSLVDLVTGETLRTYKGHKGRVNAAAFADSGRSIVSGGADGRILVWDPERPEPRTRLTGLGGNITGVAAQGELVAAGNQGGELAIWRLAQPGPPRAFVQDRRPSGNETPPAITILALAPGGDLLAAGRYDGSLGLYTAGDLGGPRFLADRTPAAHSSVVHGAAFSPDGKQLASAGAEGAVKIWDVASGQQVEVLPGHRRASRSVAFLPDGRLLSGGDDGMKLWDPKDKATLLSRRGGAGEVVAVAAAGPLLVGGRTREPRSWKLYERMNEISYDVRLSQLQSQASTLEDEEQVERHNSSKGPDLSEGPPLPEPLRRSRLKEQIQKQRAELSAQIEPLRRKPTGAIDLWAQADLELRPLRALTVYAATYAISADGRLAFYSDANLIRRYDTTTEDHLGALIGHRNGITALACSPVALILASGSTDGKVRLWDAREGKLLRELQVGRPITCVQFAPNGRSVAAGCRDGAVVVWSSDGREIGRAVSAGGPIGALGFVSDGRVLAHVGARRLALCVIGRGAAHSELKAGHDAGVASLAVTHDGGLAATGDVSGTTIVWELPSGRIRHRLSGRQRIVRSVAFSHDGRFLLTAGKAGSGAELILWDVEQGISIAEYVLSGDEASGLALDADGSKLLVHAYGPILKGIHVLDLGRYARYDSFRRIWSPTGDGPGGGPPVSPEELALWFDFRGLTALAGEFLARAPSAPANPGAGLGLAQVSWKLSNSKFEV